MDANIEDQPPMLRFESTSQVDGIATHQTGRTVYMDVIMVHIRARGDNKCEVPDEAKKTGYDSYTKEVEVKKKMSRWEENPETNELKEIVEEVLVKEERAFHEKKTIYPWPDKLKARLKNGSISKNYFDYCMNAFEYFQSNVDMPIEGTPLVDWAGASESVKRKAIDLGLNSVEKVAEMTEEAVQNIGMGSVAMRDKAKAFLAVDRDVEKTAARLVNVESDLAAFKKITEENQDALSEKDKKIKELQDRLKESKAA